MCVTNGWMDGRVPRASVPFHLNLANISLNINEDSAGEHTISHRFLLWLYRGWAGGEQGPQGSLPFRTISFCIKKSLEIGLCMYFSFPA